MVGERHDMKQQGRVKKPTQLLVGRNCLAHHFEGSPGRLQIAKVAIDFSIARWLQLYCLLQPQSWAKRLEFLGPAAHRQWDEAMLVAPGIYRLCARHPVDVGHLVESVEQQCKSVLLDPRCGDAARHLIAISEFINKPGTKRQALTPPGGQVDHHRDRPAQIVLGTVE